MLLSLWETAMGNSDPDTKLWYSGLMHPLCELCHNHAPVNPFQYEGKTFSFSFSKEALNSHLSYPIYNIQGNIQKIEVLSTSFGLI